MHFADHRHQIAQELGLVGGEAPEPARRRRNGRTADTGIVLPRPFGASPSDVRAVDLTAQPRNVGQLAACLNTLLSTGLDTRVCKGKKEPSFTPTRTDAVDDAAAIAKLEADVAEYPARRFVLFALHYANLSRRVGLCMRPYECATATHACHLTSGRPLFPGFCATCISTVRGIVTAAILIHDLCMPFEAANACKYVHVFFRECLRFHWSRNTSDKKVRDASEAAYFCAWVSVCARRVFERLEAFHVNDAAQVDAWNTACLLPLTAEAATTSPPTCDMAFPGHTSIIHDLAPYTTAPCATCRDIHRVALPLGQTPAPNPKSKEKQASKQQKKKAASESGAKRKRKSNKAVAPKRAKPSDDNTDSDADKEDDSASSSQQRLPPAPPLPAVESSMHTTEGAASFPAFSESFADSSKFADDAGADEESVHRLFENYHAVDAIVPASMTLMELSGRPVLALPPLPALPPAPAPMATMLARKPSALSSVAATRSIQAPTTTLVPVPVPVPMRARILVDDDDDE